MNIIDILKDLKSSLQVLECPSALNKAGTFSFAVIMKNIVQTKWISNFIYPHFRDTHKLKYMTDSSEFSSRELEEGRESLSGNALYYTEVCMAVIL